MSSRLSWFAGILVVLALILGWTVHTYNNFVGERSVVQARFADVQAQYQRRFDLIPNVVETVKGSAKFEQSTLQAVVAARSAWATAQNQGDANAQIQANQSFDSALSRLLVTVEAYPDLKSTQAYRDLITEIEGSENRVAVARRDYNQAVQDYNASVQRAPSNVVAKLFGFATEPFFQAQAGTDRAPQVNFNSTP